MIFRDFHGERLSLLGMGCMRLPVVGGDRAVIDEPAAAEMIAWAMDHGVNYYDTAWGYHGGHSEEVTARLLKAYPRDRYFLATKFPGYDRANMGKAEEIFTEQLRRCGTDCFDFYLVHNVCELNIEEYLDDERYGTLSYLLEQKKRGRIRHLGFSTHGTLNTMKRFLEAYGEHMEFCQIQLNWLDWEFQDGAAKMALLREWGLPVWVMEPLRGGRLAELAQSDMEKLRALRPEDTAARWACRFLQGVEGVTTVLTGASTLEQLRENICSFEREDPVTDGERELLFSIARGMTGGVPCTACRYCVDHCPRGLDIPRLLELYNEHSFTKGGFIAPMALSVVPEEKQPSACVGCRSCEAVCPQQIAIAEALADFTAKLKK